MLVTVRVYVGVQTTKGRYCAARRSECVFQFQLIKEEFKVSLIGPCHIDTNIY